jgi:DMSO/TMAO reductase YedYZ molybdopterin-dependent catalytic subunit
MISIIQRLSNKVIKKICSWIRDWRGEKMDHKVPKTDMGIEGLVRDQLEPDTKTERVTPADELFVLAHLGIPEISTSDWMLEICGLVSKPLKITFDSLSEFPKRTLETVHKCAGSPFDPTIPMRQVGNVIWGGIDMRDLMDAVGVQDAASFLWAFGPDHGEFADAEQHNYQKDVPLARIADGDVLLAYELNGEPLSNEHGFPARLVVPGYYATNSVKWLYRLEFADRRAEGFFTTTLYNDPDLKADPSGNTKSPVWEIAPESLIVSPAADQNLQNNNTEIWGWAWSNCQVRKVEVSVDGGQSWQNADLEPPTERSWQRFSIMWEPAGIGEFEIRCRATDEKGDCQPDENARNAIHIVNVNVG